jgi:Uma2 family endonuclease
MNALHDLRMDKATFLRWVQTQEGRYELVGGRVVMQDTGTWDHSDVAIAIYEVLRPLLPRPDWKISAGQISVEIGDEVRVADLLVARAGLPRKSNATDQPVLLVEVLSPSTKAADFNSKRQLYGSLRSLEIYIVASQDEPRLWIWQRARDAGRAFPENPIEIADKSAKIDLAHFRIAFKLDDVYHHIFPV